MIAESIPPNMPDATDADMQPDLILVEQITEAIGHAPQDVEFCVRTAVKSLLREERRMCGTNPGVIKRIEWADLQRHRVQVLLSNGSVKDPKMAFTAKVIRETKGALEKRTHHIIASHLQLSPSPV